MFTMTSKVRWAEPVEAYSLLSNDGSQDTIITSPKRSTSKLRHTTIVVCAILGGFFLGSVTFGGTWSPHLGKEPDILSFERHPKVLKYNRTFSENSHKTEAAWESLFPQQGGYFSHPTVAPTRATFSVFHYLHCLNGIRGAYWLLHDKAVAGEKVDEDSLPMMVSPSHIRHCIDLLRQALMCSPDLTVEVKDMEAGGVHGFGETHQCVDWTALKDWTTKWETYGANRMGQPSSHSHGHQHGSP